MALAHLPETGVTERNMAANVVVLALQALAEYTKKNKTIKIKLNGQTSMLSHGYFTISRAKAFKDSKVAESEEPELEDGIDILGEIIVSVNEKELGQDLGRRDHDDGSDSDSETKHEAKKSGKYLRWDTVGGFRGEAARDIDEEEQMRCSFSRLS
jgi:hypothetical protein